MKICSADDKKNRRYYSDGESNQTPPYSPIFGRTFIQDSVLRSFIHLEGEWEKVGDISRLQQQQRGSISQLKETDDLQFHKSSPVGTGLDQPHPKGPELQRSQVHKMAYRQSFCFLSCMRQTIQFLPSVKLEGPASFNEDRLAEREGGGRREHLSLRDAVVAALLRRLRRVRPSVQWAVTTAELPRSREKSGQRHQIKSRPSASVPARGREMNRARDSSLACDVVSIGWNVRKVGQITSMKIPCKNHEVK